VTVRAGGVNVRAAPDKDAERIMGLRENTQQPVTGLLWRD